MTRSGFLTIGRKRVSRFICKFLNARFAFQPLQVATVTLGGPALISFHRAEADGSAGMLVTQVCDNASLVQSADHVGAIRKEFVFQEICHTVRICLETWRC